MAQVDLVAMQAEQVAWSEKNFGKQPAGHPLLGMIEEICEFDFAWKFKEEAYGHHPGPDATAAFVSDSRRAKLTADVLDAVGDIAIYMLDYCGKRGWQFNDIWIGRDFVNERQRRSWSDLVPHAGKLAHHHLKSTQGIRGTQQEHDAVIMQTLCGLLAHLDVICSYMNKDFLIIVDGIWSQVRLRDWTKNKVNAHEVAEQQVIDMRNAAGNTDP